MMVKALFVFGCSSLFLLGSVDVAPGADKLDFFASQKIGVNIEGLQKALEAVQKESSTFRHDDDAHFLKSAEFYTRGEFMRAGKEFFSYALKHSPKVGAALDKAALEKRDGILVLTFDLKGEARLSDKKLLMLGGSMVYFCDPVTGEVLFFRGGK